MFRRLILPLLLLVLVACGQSPELVVPVVLNSPAGALPGPPVVVATWLGQEQRVELQRHAGTDGGERYTGSLRGSPLRMLPLRFEVDADGEVGAWYAALEVVRVGEPLRYAVDVERPGNIRRVPLDGNFPANGRGLRRLLALRAAWACVALVVVIGVAARRQRGVAVAARARWWWDATLWLLLGIVLTWPAVLAGPDLLVGRHFDMPGTIWSLDAIPRLFPAFRDGLTGFPDGADYRAFDSFTLVPLGLLLSWVDSARLVGFVAVIGVASSGWAATVAARGFGARGPTAWIAGLGFAASGLSASAMLEGHVYHLLDPWLPLFALSWWRATRPGGTVRDGAMAGLFFGLALLTTGYLAAAGGLLLLGLGLSGLWSHGPRVKPWLAALAAVAPALALELVSLHGHHASSFHDPEAVAGSANSLALLLGATPETDLVGHSLAPAPLPTVLALACLAPLVLGRARGWRPLVFTALLALALSFGPRLTAGQLEPFAASPLAGLWQLPGAALLRFPARLSWAWMLCISILAARVATVLAPGRIAALVLALALTVDVGFAVGLPGRQGTLAGGASSAYDAVDGPVFELLPETIDDGGELDSWLSALACYRQTVHGHALAEDCVTVPVRDNPRFVLGRTVQPLLLAGRIDEARALLVDRGFAAVAWHPDLFSESTRARLGASLAMLDADPVERTDGAQHLIVYRLGEGAVSDAGDGLDLRGAPGAPGQLDQLDLLVRVPRHVRPPTRLAAVLETASGESERTITPVSSVPGDWPGDAGWLTRWSEPGPGPYRLRLTAPDEGGVVLWEGRLAPAKARDQVELAVSRGEDGILSAQTLGLCPPSNSLALTADTGLVAVDGWLAWLLVFVVGGGWLRRRWAEGS